MMMEHANLLGTLCGASMVFITVSLLLAQCCCCKKSKKTKGKQPKTAAGAKGAKKQGAAAKDGPKKITKPKDEPRFNAIKSDLLSYEEANQHLRRAQPPTTTGAAIPPLLLPCPPAPAAETPELPEPVDEAAAGPKLKIEKPDEEGKGSTPDYDTLNFMQQKDVFEVKDGNNAKPEEPVAEQQQAEDGADAGPIKEGVAPTGMAEEAGGDYETLADLQRGDIFNKNG